MSEGSDGDCISIGVERCDDGSLVVFRCGRVGVLSGGSVVTRKRMSVNLPAGRDSIRTYR